MWNWIKQKVKRFWKWLVFVAVGGVVMTVALVPEGTECFLDKTLKPDLSKFQEVSIIGKGYYQNFRDPKSGSVVVEETTKENYEVLATKDYPQPAKVDYEWGGSYETLKFDTPSGFLEDGQYAYTGQGNEYLIKIAGKGLDECGLDTSLVSLGINKAFAAVAFDNSADSTWQSNVSSYTYSHTNTGDHLIMLVWVFHLEATDLDRDVSGITYNSVSLTEVRSEDSGADVAGSVWYLLNPATGSNTIAVTLVGNNLSTVSQVVSLTGANQATPEADNGQFLSSGTSVTTSVTTIADNAWVVDGVALHTLNVLTVDAGQTERENSNNASNAESGMSTEGPNTPAGSVSLTWTDGGDPNGDKWIHIVVSVAPSRRIWHAIPQ